MMRRSRVVLSAVLCSGLVWTASGAGFVPTPISSLSMGGAGVASVENCEALLVNPAALGLSEADVGMHEGESRQRFRLEVSTTVMTRGLSEFLRQGLKHRNSLGETNVDTLLVRDPSLFGVLWDINRQPFGVRPELQITLMTGNMAFSGWALGDAGFTLRHRALLPSADLSDTVSFGGQVGMAQTLIHNELWIGLSSKLLVTQTGRYSAEVTTATESMDSLNQVMSDQIYLRKLGWASAADVGVLWLPALEWRIGSALRDMGMHIDGKMLTPQWDVGASWFPLSEQCEGAWKRRFSLSAGLIDLLDDGNDWKPLSKVALGGQYQVSPLPWRLLSVRLSVGLLGGYPTAGVGLDALRVLHLDMNTWARESGWYTGQLPDRIWSVRSTLGW